MLKRVVLAGFGHTFTVIARRVDYTRDPSQVIGAISRVKYVDYNVIATIPRVRQGVHQNVRVVFFKPGQPFNVYQAKRECEARNLVFDPYALAAVNEADPAFADKYPNSSHWDYDGRVHSYLVFYRFIDGVRYMLCRRDEGDCLGSRWFSGVPKS
jgi:hypothetical protein